MQTIREIAKIIQSNNPTIQLYWIEPKGVIGYWNHSLNRVQLLVSSLLDGRWAPMPELLINGEPPFSADEWEPISYEWIYG